MFYYEQSKILIYKTFFLKLKFYYFGIDCIALDIFYSLNILKFHCKIYLTKCDINVILGSYPTWIVYILPWNNKQNKLGL